MRRLTILLVALTALIAMLVGCGADVQPEEAAEVSTDNLEIETAKMERALAAVPARPLTQLPGLASWAVTTDDKAPILIAGEDAAGKVLVAYELSVTSEGGLRIAGKSGAIELSPAFEIVTDTLGQDDLAIVEAAYDDTSVMLAKSVESESADEAAADDGLVPDEAPHALSRPQALKCAKSSARAVGACVDLASVGKVKLVAKLTIKFVDQLSKSGKLTKKNLLKALGKTAAGAGCVCDLVQVACDCFKHKRSCRLSFC